MPKNRNPDDKDMLEDPEAILLAAADDSEAKTPLNDTVTVTLTISAGIYELAKPLYAEKDPCKSLAGELREDMTFDGFLAFLLELSLLREGNKRP